MNYHEWQDHLEFHRSRLTNDTDADRARENCLTKQTVPKGHICASCAREFPWRNHFLVVFFERKRKEVFELIKSDIHGKCVMPI